MTFRSLRLQLAKESELGRSTSVASLALKAEPAIAPLGAAVLVQASASVAARRGAPGGPARGRLRPLARMDLDAQTPTELGPVRVFTSVRLRSGEQGRGGPTPDRLNPVNRFFSMARPGDDATDRR